MPKYMCKKEYFKIIFCFVINILIVAQFCFNLEASGDDNMPVDPRKNALLSQNYQSDVIPDLKDIPHDKLLKIGAESASLISNNEVFTANLLSLYANQDCYINGNCNNLFTLNESSDILNIVEKLQNGQIYMMFLPSNLQRDLLNGVGVFQSRPYSRLRFIMAFYEQIFTIIVKSDSKIKSLRDLSGKKVNISQNNVTIKTLLQGIDKKSSGELPNFTITKIEADKQIAALCSGNVDAIMLLVAHPNPYINKLTKVCDIDILPINQSLISNMLINDPSYSAAMIKGGIYLGIPQDISSFSVWQTLVASEEASDKLIYDISNSVVKRLEKLRQIDKIFANIDKKTLFDVARIAPIHNGVARFISDMNKK